MRFVLVSRDAITPGNDRQLAGRVIMGTAAWRDRACLCTEIIFVATLVYVYYWRELPQVPFLPRQTFVATNTRQTQKFCRDKITFVATKDVFCRDKHVFVATNVFRDKNYTCGSSVPPLIYVCLDGWWMKLSWSKNQPGDQFPTGEVAEGGWR